MLTLLTNNNLNWLRIEKENSWYKKTRTMRVWVPCGNNLLKKLEMQIFNLPLIVYLMLL